MLLSTISSHESYPKLNSASSLISEVSFINMHNLLIRDQQKFLALVNYSTPWLGTAWHLPKWFLHDLFWQITIWNISRWTNLEPQIMNYASWDDGSIYDLQCWNCMFLACFRWNAPPLQTCGTVPVQVSTVTLGPWEEATKNVLGD